MGVPVDMHMAPGGGRVCLHKGRLSAEEVDVIVVPADTFLTHGSGIGAEIARASGGAVAAEADSYVRRFGPVPAGEVAWTGGGALSVRGVIHAVLPPVGGADLRPAVPRAALSAFRYAAQRGFHSLAMPAFGCECFPAEPEGCARALMKAANDFLTDHPVETLNEIRFTIEERDALEAFMGVFRELFRPEAKF